MSSPDEDTNTEEPAALRGGNDGTATPPDGTSTPPNGESTPPPAAAASHDNEHEGETEEDELLRLKRQVAALAASEGLAKKKDDEEPKLTKETEDHHSKKKNKKKSIFSYWEATSSHAPGAAGAAPVVGSAAGPGSVASPPPNIGSPHTPKHQTFGSPTHSYTPTATFTPPLGRPPSQSAKLLYNNSPEIKKVGHGEKWNPTVEIQRGKVSRFHDRFDHPSEHNDSLHGTMKRSEHGEKWAPDKEIDANRIDSIKAMWGAKTAGSAPKAPYTGSGRVNTSMFERKSDGGVKPPPLVPQTSGRRWKRPEPKVAAGVAGAAAVGVGVGAAVAVSNEPKEVAAAAPEPAVAVEEEAPQAAEAVAEPPVAAPAPDFAATEASREEIVALVAEVLPDELESVDDLLAQFEGREDKLLATLQGMKSRVATADDYDESVDGDEDEVDAAEVDGAVVTPDGSHEGMEEDVVEAASIGGDQSTTGASSSRRSAAASSSKSKRKVAAAATVGGAAAIGTAAALSSSAVDPDAMNDEMSSHAMSTIESKEGDDKFGNSVSGLPLNPSWLGKSPNAHDTTTDHFTGQSYRYDSPEKRPSGDSDEEMGIAKGMPLVRATPSTRDMDGRMSDSGMSFETFSIGVPSHIASPPKHGRASQRSVVSEMGEPNEGPWYKKRRTRIYGGIALVLLAVIGAVLGLYFSGTFGGGGDEPNNEKDSVAVVVPPVVTVAPTSTPSSVPSGMPSGSPISACELAIGTEYATLALGKSPNAEPPNVAMDGSNAAVVTNSGDIQFFRLGSDNVWKEAEFFPNINRSDYTPAVALSGDIAVVGFLYQILGFNQGTGGAYVYERDADTGKWKLVEVLTPDEGVDGTAGFGWSVDVDTSPRYPLLVVGAYAEEEGRGSVYAFERRSNGSWDRAGKIQPEMCLDGNFGYSVAVHGDLIAASTDCDSIVQVHRYQRATGSFEYAQEIRYISFDLGAVSALVMNEDNLVYSTVYGGVIIYERGSTASRTFDFAERLDVYRRGLVSYPLAIDEDLLVVGVGNQYAVLPKSGDSWYDGSLTIENDAASSSGASPVAVSGRDILAASGDPHEVYHYNIADCAGESATTSPTFSHAPTISPEPTMAPTTRMPTRSPMDSWTFQPSISSSPTNPTTAAPTKMPTNKPTPLEVTTPATSTPTRKPTPPPSSAATPPPQTPPPSTSATPPPPTPPTSETTDASCFPTEISILFDSSPLGSGYVLVQIDSETGAENSVDTFFPFDSSLVNERYVKELCLEKGSYKFTMYDSAGDGICCANGDGGYAVTSNGVILAQGGEFGFSEESRFELPTSSQVEQGRF